MIISVIQHVNVHIDLLLSSLTSVSTRIKKKECKNTIFLSGNALQHLERKMEEVIITKS